MTTKEKKDIEDGIYSFNKTIRADEDSFETKITYLNAGAITLILTFLSFREQAGYLTLMVAGIVLCGLSLMINIAQYLIAKIWHRACVDKLIAAEDTGEYIKPDDLKDKVIKKIDTMNWAVLMLAISGIALLILFVCLNA